MPTVLKRRSIYANTDDVYLLLTSAVFVVSLGYGSLLPVTVPFIEHLADGGRRYDTSWHAGMLTGVYTLALFAFAPICGRFADHVGLRPVLLTGLAGYVATVSLFGLSPTLFQAYAMRVASGVFAAAVLPVAMAFAGASHPAEQRARRFAGLSAAAGLGLLAGPALSGFTTRAGATSSSAGLWHWALASPFAVAAALGALAWVALFFRLPSGVMHTITITQDGARVRPTLFLLLMLLMFGIGSFEVAIALRAQRFLGMPATAISLIFMECSVVMIAAQLAVFRSSPAWLHSGLVTTSAFVALAGGMALLPYSDSDPGVVGLVGLIAAAAGILVPVVNYRISVDAGDHQGAALGKSIAAGNLGQAAGSFAAGVLFNVRPEAPFWLSAGLLAGAALVSTRVAATARNVACPSTEEERG